MARSILITGGAGFVGSSLAIQLKTHYPQYKIKTLDNLKRRGSELNLTRLREAGVEFFQAIFVILKISMSSVRLIRSSKPQPTLPF